MAAINLPIVSKFVDKGVKDAQGAFGGLTKSLGKIGGAIAAAFSVTAITSFTKESIAGAEAAEIASRRLGQVAESMGIFGNQTAAVTKRLNEYAEANEFSLAVDADVIKATQAKLLTFKELAQTADSAGGSFDRATAAALDLAAAGFGTAESNAVQLGKALNDPIKGITALTRSGITFTKEEREKIKTLTESGRVLEAQNMILSAIETQVGGTAKATASASERINLAFNAVKDGVGFALLPAFESLSLAIVPLAEDLAPALGEAFEGVIPIFTQALEVLPQFAEALTPAIPVLLKLATSVLELVSSLLPALLAIIKVFVPILGLFADVLGAVADIITDNIDVVASLVIGITAASLAFKAYSIVVGVVTGLQKALTLAVGLYKVATGSATAAQIGLNTALLANPIGLVVAAVAALVAGLIYFFTQTKLGQEVWANFTQFLGSAMTSAGEVIKGVWTGISSFMKSTINGILGFIQSFSNGIIDGINAVVRAINSIQVTIPSWIPGIGGKKFGFDLRQLSRINIPRLAEGGIVMPQPGGVLANLAEAGRPEAVIPLDRSGDFGSTNNNYNITVNAGMGADGTRIGEQIVNEILRFERSSGRVFARA
jgi:phage-related protein